MRTTRRWQVAAGLGIAILGLGGAAAGKPTHAGKQAWSGEGAPAEIVIAQPGAGETALEVSGQVFAPDGVTPAAGVVLYVYHTDASGRYSPLPGGPPRLRGWMRTDGEGRYRYRTIRPGPYPGRRQAAHVHTQLWGGGHPAQWNQDLLFADDPLLPDAERRRAAASGRFAHVCAAPPDAGGILHCRHDLRLKAAGDEFEDNTRHGLAGPRAGGGR